MLMYSIEEVRAEAKGEATAANNNRSVLNNEGAPCRAVVDYVHAGC